MCDVCGLMHSQAGLLCIWSTEKQIRRLWRKCSSSSSSSSGRCYPAILREEGSSRGGRRLAAEAALERGVQGSLQGRQELQQQRHAGPQRSRELWLCGRRAHVACHPPPGRRCITRLGAACSFQACWHRLLPAGHPQPAAAGCAGRCCCDDRLAAVSLQSLRGRLMFGSPASISNATCKSRPHHTAWPHRDVCV